MQNRKLKIGIVILIVFVVVIGAIALMLLNSEDDSSLLTSKEQKARSRNVFTIETDFCNLSYPHKWEKSINYEIHNYGDGYTVGFSSEGNNLFDLIFNVEEGEFIGSFKLDNKTIVVNASTYEIDSSIKNYKNLSMMQDDMSIIIYYLVKDYGLDFESVEIELLSNEVYQIETSKVQLYYPVTWQYKVQVNETSKGVEFSSDGVKLFDINFGGTEGSLLGKYLGQEIRIVTYVIDESQYNNSRYTELRSMQEDIDIIIKHLEEDENFKLNEI